MATSSIFANVQITTPEGAERFAHALELSEKDPPIPAPTNTVFDTNRKEIIERLRQKFAKTEAKA